MTAANSIWLKTPDTRNVTFSHIHYAIDFYTRIVYMYVAGDFVEPLYNSPSLIPKLPLAFQCMRSGGGWEQGYTGPFLCRVNVYMIVYRIEEVKPSSVYNL